MASRQRIHSSWLSPDLRLCSDLIPELVVHLQRNGQHIFSYNTSNPLLLGEWYILEYLITRYPSITGPDIFVFAFFLLCTVICYGVSVTYHTLMNHSNKVEKLWLRMDLVGITIYNLGAFTSGIYMIFWCEPVPRAIYWSMVSQYLFTHFWFAITYPTLLGLTDRSPRIDEHPHNGEPQISDPKASRFSNSCIRSDCHIWLCTGDSRLHHFRRLPNA